MKEVYVGTREYPSETSGGLCVDTIEIFYDPVTRFDAVLARYLVVRYTVYSDGSKERVGSPGLWGRSLGAAKRLALQDDSLRSSDFVWRTKKD